MCVCAQIDMCIDRYAHFKKKKEFSLVDSISVVIILSFWYYWGALE